MTPLDRFLCRIQKTESCWLWTGWKREDGYGRMEINYKQVMVHRFSYEHFVGPITDGLQIDHLCRNKSCVNPAHLELVTSAVNTRRWSETITHCPAGHPYSGDNLGPNGKGGKYRRCKACGRDYWRKKQQRLKATTALKP